MGIRACPAAELVFDGAEIPVANRLGGEGEGYKIALSALGEGRISIAAACVGIARAGLEASARYLQQRKAFGAPLVEQQGLRFMLAEMAREVAAARAVTREAAAAKDRGEPIAEASSIAKWTASDAAMRVATDAVQLFGASGYSRETGIERLMRDAKGAQIYEGTNQIHRLIVADELLKSLGPARTSLWPVKANLYRAELAVWTGDDALARESLAAGSTIVLSDTDAAEIADELAHVTEQVLG